MTFKRFFTRLAPLLLAIALAPARADDYTDTIKSFQKASESSSFFGNCYGYAVFPTIGKGGVVVGAAHGNGRVYAKGAYVGDTSMTQLTVGAQLGGQAYSQIIFFQDKRAFDEFTTGEFEFGAQATAVAITAGRLGAGHHRRHRRRQEHHQRQGPGGQQLPERHGGVHRRQGWFDVRSLHRWPEVQLQEEIDPRHRGGAMRAIPRARLGPGAVEQHLHATTELPA